MKKLICYVITALICVGCNQTKKTPQSDSVADSASAVKMVKLTERDSIETVALKALNFLKAKDYVGFSALFHPKEGVGFSPYGYIELDRKKFLAKEFLEAMKKDIIITWGEYDATGEPIKENIVGYLQSFVYNADYLNAPEKSYNLTLAQGNMINNVDKAYPNLNYIEYYFKGFKKEYEGMDWTSLKLVFKKYEGEYYLVGVVHDQWTS